MKDFSHDSFVERLKKGKAQEAIIIDKLRSYDLPIEEVTKKQDIKEKIDGTMLVDFQVTKRYKWLEKYKGEKINVQIKFRTDKYSDLLFDLYEPYHGPGHPKTKEGRDLVGNYQMYICQMSNGMIYIVDAEECKKVIDNHINEWLTNDQPLKPGKKSMYYRNEKGVQIGISIDNKSGIPKMLGFIPPNVIINKVII